jgi:hypothetical protein
MHKAFVYDNGFTRLQVVPKKLITAHGPEKTAKHHCKMHNRDRTLYLKNHHVSYQHRVRPAKLEHKKGYHKTVRRLCSQMRDNC